MLFLGLASNYSAGNVFRHLFAFGAKKDSDKLRQALGGHYGASSSSVALYHSGRSALTVAFQNLAAPGSPVILPGLTCIAVVRAIKAAGCTPVYCDIDPDTLQYDYRLLEQKIKEAAKNAASPAPRSKKSPQKLAKGIIVVQNTLGIPADIQKIEKLARANNFLVVEDLAHCAGRFYTDGREIGTVGAAAALSFGKGKAVDTICGGALIMRSGSEAAKSAQSAKPAQSAQSENTSQLAKSAQPIRLTQPRQKPRTSTCARDRWYPFFGLIARILWPLGVGKPLISALVHLRWIERSADTALDTSVRLTHWQSKLALRQLRLLWRGQPNLRQSGYKSACKKSNSEHLAPANSEQNLAQSSKSSQKPAQPLGSLREYALVDNREEVLKEFLQVGYQFSEIWYDTPVAPVRYAAETDFPAKACPNTVRIAAEIINLPTWYPAANLNRAHKIIEAHLASPKTRPASAENHKGVSHV